GAGRISHRVSDETRTDLRAVANHEYLYCRLHRHRLLVPAVHDPAALREPGKNQSLAVGSGPGPRLAAVACVLADYVPAVVARRVRRLHARIHSRRRRIRDPRTAGWNGDSDDRQDVVERVLQQSRLAFGLGG